MSIHFFFRLLACLSSLGGLSHGYAITARGMDHVLIAESEPIDTTVLQSNGLLGTTPTSFKIPRKNPLVAKIKRHVYETLRLNVDPTLISAGVGVCPVQISLADDGVGEVLVEGEYRGILLSEFD